MRLAIHFVHGVLNTRYVILLLSALLIVLGSWSFQQLPIEPYPNISPLNVQVITQ